MKPHFLILLRNGRAYINRWYLLPRNRWFNVYLHKTMEDDYPVLHDHPWNNLSIVLSGGYYETVPQPITKRSGVYYGPTITRFRKPGSIIYRPFDQPHRLSLRTIPGFIPKTTHLQKQVCWTLFITGPKKREVLIKGRLESEWGFHTRDGWISHVRLVKIENGISQVTAEGEELLK